MTVGVPYDCPDALQNPGDPAVGWVYPEGNWLNRYLFSPGTGSSLWCHDHVTIVAALSDWDQWSRRIGPAAGLPRASSILSAA
ncbi:hypothetical protein G6O69_16740 [Pseudenhygromyxa sp. WMMC2535]|uniref:hypothetical protein n=1 Tax=Pseudenhygromyxa sp. WMMC2535 TaxID=2712867 RepID=UPI0015546242|nr:hypothetical protein [Pseudenhygromyxa sp. WMMC2535]NVB39492.1 hypothetical protein [Pseudenhygromyxa sp. WMMC2535]